MVVGALEALQQVRAVLGFQEGGEGLGAFDQQGQVVIAGHGKAGVDQVVADALVFEVDFEAVVEEGEEVWKAFQASEPILVDALLAHPQR